MPIFIGSSLYLCVFFILTFSFCKSTLCAALALCVPLLFPPPHSPRLSSVITALDSSSDGKCFSIPLSPSLSLNLHLSIFFSPSKLYLGYYRDVFIECALSYFPPQASLPFLPSFSSAPPVFCVQSFLALWCIDGHLCLRSHFNFFGD